MEITTTYSELKCPECGKEIKEENITITYISGYTICVSLKCECRDKKMGIGYKKAR